MIKKPLQKLSTATAALALSLASCATSVNSFKPDKIDSDKAVFFGNIKMYNGAEDITSTCYANFTDSNFKTIIRFDMDESGWVFGTSKIEDVYVVLVQCRIGNLVVKGIAGFHVRDLKFKMLGQEKVTYFGHLTHRSNDTVSGFIISSTDRKKPELGPEWILQKKLIEAISYYRDKFPNEPSSKTIEVSPLEFIKDSK